MALQVVSDANILLTPFLPHSAQKIHELLGGTGVHAPQPSIVEVEDLDGGPGYPVLTGDYTVGARWESVPIESGRALTPPKARRATRPSRGAKERRLQAKKQRSQRKTARSTRGWGE